MRHLFKKIILWALAADAPEPATNDAAALDKLARSLK